MKFDPGSVADRGVGDRGRDQAQSGAQQECEQPAHAQKTVGPRSALRAEI